MPDMLGLNTIKALAALLYEEGPLTTLEISKTLPGKYGWPVRRMIKTLDKRGLLAYRSNKWSIRKVEYREWLRELRQAERSRRSNGAKKR